MKKWLEEKKDTQQGSEANESGMHCRSSFRGQMNMKEYFLNCSSPGRSLRTLYLIEMPFNRRFLTTILTKKRNASKILLAWLSE
jgi:hypothetical protein